MSPSIYGFIVRFSLVLVLLVGAALVAPLASADDGLRGSSSTSSATSDKAASNPLPDPTPPAQIHANQVSEDIQNLVAKSPGYGGLWVDKTGLTHVAVTPSEATRVNAILNDRFKNDFVLEQRAVTYRQLEARRDRVNQLMPALRSAGLDLLEWGPDEVHGTLWVSLKHYSPDKATRVRQMLGDDVIVEQAMAGGADDMYSRTSDWSPYSAGIYLSTDMSMCSSGMPILVGGNRYLVTAGHCHDPNLGTPFPADVYNGGAKIGRANWADFSGGGIDAAIVTAAGSLTLYRTETAYVATGGAPWNSAVGQTICSGGAFTGERCALPVIKVNYCASYYPNRTTCGVSTAGAPGAEAAGHGDSGGPMYIVSPSVRISGIIVAPASPQYTCSTHPEGGRTCSDYVRFQMASSILSHWQTTM